MKRNDFLVGLLLFACIAGSRAVNPQAYPWLVDWGAHLPFLLGGLGMIWRFWRREGRMHFHLLGYAAMALFALAQIADVGRMGITKAAWVYAGCIAFSYALRPLEWEQTRE